MGKQGLDKTAAERAVGFSNDMDAGSTSRTRLAQIVYTYTQWTPVGAATVGGRPYTRADFETSKRLLEEDQISIRPWTVARPLEEGQAAFDMLVSDPGDTLKIILNP